MQVSEARSDCAADPANHVAQVQSTPAAFPRHHATLQPRRRRNPLPRRHRPLTHLRRLLPASRKLLIRCGRFLCVGARYIVPVLYLPLSWRIFGLAPSSWYFTSADVTCMPTQSMGTFGNKARDRRMSGCRPKRSRTMTIPSTRFRYQYMVFSPWRIARALSLQSSMAAPLQGRFRQSADNC